MKKALTILLSLLFVLPSAGLVAGAAVVNVAATSCSSATLVVGDIPDSLTARTQAGRMVTLTRRQLTRAATIIAVGAQTPGVGRDGVGVALMVGLTESSLRMLANTHAVPESARYAHDGDGGDHDSLGLFQMRPSTGWGTVAELMDATYQARAFYGGPTGPNNGSPRGLLDIDNWQTLAPGVAAQSVEVSAFPDRYADYEPVAEAILTALTRGRPAPDGAAVVPETSRVVFPLPKGSYTFASAFGWRIDPFTGKPRFHAGTDYAAAGGTPILAVADGIVTFAHTTQGFGGLIIVTSIVDGQRVAAYYAHMWPDGILVSKGEHVNAGQHIGDVGSSGRSTGPHLHLEIHPGGTRHSPIDSNRWLKQHGAQVLDDGDSAITGCGVAA